MADFSIASQIRPMQLPDPLQQYAQFNQLALHQAQLAEVQRAANEQNQMRQFLASGGDPYSAAGLQQVGMISPQLRNTYEKEADARKTAKLNQELLRAQVGQIPLQNEKARGEVDAQRQTAMAADQKHFTEQLNKTLAYKDDAQAAAVYDAVRANAVHKYEGLDAVWPKTFDRGVLEKQMLTAEQTAQAQAAERLANQPTVSTVAGMPPMLVNKQKGTFSMAQEAAPGNAPSSAGAPFAAPANTPAAVMQQPTAAPAGINAYTQGLNAAEGTGKNPMSSAQGKFQFINSTFVDTAKKVFPELENKSPTEILALRGQKLPNGSQIEDVLEQRLRADNTRSLADAGIQPTPGNVYLAHFLGAGGARNVLSADPNTPVSQLVDPRAIAANKSVLEGKTAGDVQAWANSKFGNQPGLAASMTTGNARLGGAPTGFVPAGNAPTSLGAPTVNNALMASMMAGQAAPANMLAAPAAPPLAAPAAMPVAQTPTAPTTFAEAEAQRQQRVVTQKAAETLATENAKNQAKSVEALPKLRESTQVLKTTLNQMLGNTKIDAKGRVVEDPNAPLHPGFGQAVGFSASKLIAPNTPFAGTDRADFEALFKQVQGGAFLDAYNILRGGGPIANVEGEKATAAKNAMSLATTEKAFIKAANDYTTALDRGLAIMEKQAAGGAAPATASAGGAAPAATTYTEGQTATGPNGAKVIFRNGQWTAQ